MNVFYYIISFFVILFLILTLFLIATTLYKPLRKKKYTRYAYYIHHFILFVGGVTLMIDGIYYPHQINIKNIIAGLFLIFISYTLFKDVNKILGIKNED